MLRTGCRLQSPPKLLGLDHFAFLNPMDTADEEELKGDHLWEAKTDAKWEMLDAIAERARAEYGGTGTLHRLMLRVLSQYFDHVDRDVRKEDSKKPLKIGQMAAYLEAKLGIDKNKIRLVLEQLRKDGDEKIRKEDFVSHLAIKEIRLVQLRNPWGYGEWAGSWSDQCVLHDGMAEPRSSPERLIYYIELAKHFALAEEEDAAAKRAAGAWKLKQLLHDLGVHEPEKPYSKISTELRRFAEKRKPLLEKELGTVGSTC